MYSIQGREISALAEQSEQLPLVEPEMAPLLLRCYKKFQNILQKSEITGHSFSVNFENGLNFLKCNK